MRCFAFLSLAFLSLTYARSFSRCRSEKARAQEPQKYLKKLKKEKVKAAKKAKKAFEQKQKEKGLIGMNQDRSATASVSK